MSAAPVVLKTALRSLPLLGRGKVRDIYAVGDDRLLLVQTDRISAFDIVLPQGIPGKGAALTAMSRFWFKRLEGILPNHFLPEDPEALLADDDEKQVVRGRAMVARRLTPLPLEAIVRGYITGSGWKDYQATGEVSGVKLPSGMKEAEKFPAPLYTPSTKAEQGAHDEAISFAQTEELVGAKTAAQARDAAVALYSAAAQFAEQRGIIIADTKFEFAMDDGGLILIDEALTPDSSRFWPQNEWAPGKSPPSFDKQYVRDWLAKTGWDRKSPPPDLPPEVVAQAAEKYRDIRRRLTGE